MHREAANVRAKLDTRRLRHATRQALKTGRPAKLIRPQRWAKRPEQPLEPQGSDVRDMHDGDWGYP